LVSKEVGSFTEDIYLNKPVTKEVPYWLLREHQFSIVLFETRHCVPVSNGYQRRVIFSGISKPIVIHTPVFSVPSENGSIRITLRTKSHICKKKSGDRPRVSEEAAGQVDATFCRISRKSVRKGSRESEMPKRNVWQGVGR
jgi:hypothetical protein